MARITKPELARGTKLTRQHVHLPLSAAADALSLRVDTTQMETPRAPGRLNLFVPLLDELPSHPNSDGTGYTFPMAIPFTLPPTQDYWDASGQQSVFVPHATLVEVSLSFDQRGQPVSIHSRLTGYGDPAYNAAGGTDCLSGEIVAGVTRLAMTLAIHEKTQTFFQGATPSRTPDRELLHVDIPYTAFEGTIARQNPFVLGDLAIALRPYKTYLLTLDVPGLYDTITPLCLPSLHISLKYLMPLMQRDASSGAGNTVSVQNAPETEQNPTPAVVAVVLPAAGGNLLADGSGGVQTNLEIIDAAYRAKLTGGMSPESLAPVAENILTSAAYEIIAVPLFNNNFPYRKVSNYPPGKAADPLVCDLDYLPYSSLIPGFVPNYRFPIGDRRIVMLDAPIVIHHVIAVQCYKAPIIDDAVLWSAAPLERPASATWRQQIGVAVGVGYGSALARYQQVALADMTVATRDNFLIDMLNDNYRLPGLTYRDFDLFNVPLVGGPVLAGANPGSGYTIPATTNIQGKPFFAGQATTAAGTRSDAYRNGTNDWGPALTRGAEQFIEVRWRFEDNGPLGLLASLGGVPPCNYVGYGGAWVYIIGKRALVAA